MRYTKSADWGFSQFTRLAVSVPLAQYAMKELGDDHGDLNSHIRIGEETDVSQPAGRAALTAACGRLGSSRMTLPGWVPVVP